MAVCKLHYETFPVSLKPANHYVVLFINNGMHAFSQSGTKSAVYTPQLLLYVVCHEIPDSQTGQTVQSNEPGRGLSF
jgi:hypothetical protein